MFVMDADTPGVEILRPMQVFGHDDAPYGHMHLRFTNVRLPASAVVLSEGRGFEVAQGSLDQGAYTIVCVRLDRRKKHWK